MMDAILNFINSELRVLAAIEQDAKVEEQYEVMLDEMYFREMDLWASQHEWEYGDV